TIATVLVGGVGAYYQMGTRVALLEADLSRATRNIESMQADRADLKERVARIEEKLSTQMDVLQRILRNTENSRAP
ncbi:hypothetical protein AB4144_60780, partial [Rhizobiaceae sp. 2RAB30]